MSSARSAKSTIGRANQPKTTLAAAVANTMAARISNVIAMQVLSASGPTLTLRKVTGIVAASTVGAVA